MVTLWGRNKGSCIKPYLTCWALCDRQWALYWVWKRIPAGPISPLFKNNGLPPATIVDVSIKMESSLIAIICKDFNDWVIIIKIKIKKKHENILQSPSVYKSLIKLNVCVLHDHANLFNDDWDIYRSMFISQLSFGIFDFITKVLNLIIYLKKKCICWSGCLLIWSLLQPFRCLNQQSLLTFRVYKITYFHFHGTGWSIVPGVTSVKTKD